MAKTKISEFSATPGNNTDIDGINIAEGCAPSGINDAIRELMAQLKDWQAGTSNDPYVVGSSGSLTLSYGTANGVPYLNGSKVVTSGSALTFDGTNFATTGSVTSAGSSNSGNLAFTGTGNRITGDFSNATLANRVAFQTSTTNGPTQITAMPNGTSTQSQFTAVSGTDLNNANGVQIRATSTEAAVMAYNTGSASALPMTFYTGGSERMRVDTSGNVGIGTSSPTARLTVVTGASGNNEGEIRLSENATYYAGLRRVNASDEFRIGSYGASQNITFYTVSSERARIDSSGNLLVNTTAQQTGGNGKLSVAGGSGGVAATLTNNSNASAYTTEIYNYTTSTGAGSGRYVKFAMGSTPTQTGSIIGDGTNTAYNTSSDYRLKENVAPMTGALALVMQQRPVTWTWKTSGKPGKGFIAHWLQEDGAGECVSGEKDAVDADGNPDYQGVDTSFLIATLTAAIQEQQAIITSLTARVTALETN